MIPRFLSFSFPFITHSYPPPKKSRSYIHCTITTPPPPSPHTVICRHHHHHAQKIYKNVSLFLPLLSPSEHACNTKIGRDVSCMYMCSFNTFHPLHGQSIHHCDIIEKRTGWNMLGILLGILWHDIIF